MHYAPPTAEQLKHHGSPHEPSDFPQEQDCDVWEDNWDAISLYQMNQTQWRMGPAGPYGFDMMVYRHELDRRQYDRAEYDEMLWALSIIEAAALAEMTKD